MPLKLTDREKQVVAKVCLCQKRKTIADELGISIRTVDVYLRRIRRKIGVSSMLEVAVFFTRESHDFHSRE